MSTTAKTAKVILPVRVGAGWPLQIKTGANGDGGWSTIDCDSVEEARRIMREYPTAAMPCWRNPAAEWNR